MLHPMRRTNQGLITFVSKSLYIKPLVSTREIYDEEISTQNYWPVQIVWRFLLSQLVKQCDLI